MMPSFLPGENRMQFAVAVPTVELMKPGPISAVSPLTGYCSGPGWTFGTEIDYVSELTKSVTFRNDRVVEWEAQH